METTDKNCSKATAQYPDYINRLLLPNLEVSVSNGIRIADVWTHENQSQGIEVSGLEVFACLLPDQETYKATPNDLIHKCASLADLLWYKANPHKIPQHLQLMRLYAFKSIGVEEDAPIDDNLWVPYIQCNSHNKYVNWTRLNTKFSQMNVLLSV